MVRTGSLGGGFGSISPFRGGGASFGAFDVANTKSASVQEQASLEWAKARAMYDSGLIDDAAYQAAQQAYYAALDPASQGYATGQYQIAQTAYSISRDQLVQQVQAGTASYDDLVAFDANALAQIQPGSAEYRQRQDRLWSSQANAFQSDERKVLRDLQDQRITNQQAQDWYKAQAQRFPDNVAVQNDITDKIGQMQDRIYSDLDNQLAKDWQAGRLTIGQVLAYAAKVSADPEQAPARVNALKDFVQQAKGQAVEKSLSFRYDLTREYISLSQFVKSAASATGSVGSQSVRVYLGADGTWKTAVVTKAHTVSAAEAAAKQKRDVQVAQARARMAEITKEVGQLAGGWVTADDVIANYRQQQATMAKGSPEWFAIQHAIDGLTQQKADDAAQAALGIRVTFPKVGSELIRDLSVGATERATGFTSAERAKAQPYLDRIAAYQSELDAGASDQRAATLRAAIDKNYGYLASLGGAGATPALRPGGAVPPGGAVTGGGGGGAGTGAAASGLGTTATGTAATGARGPFLLIETDAQGNPVSHPLRQTKGATGPAAALGFNAVWTKTSAAGWPVNASPTAFDDLYDHAVAAVRNGATSFAYGGKAYAVPTNPADRINWLRELDNRNVELKEVQYKVAVAEGYAPSTIDSKLRSYAKARNDAITNSLYVLDASMPGTVKVDGKAIKITGTEGVSAVRVGTDEAGKPVYENRAANSLGFARDIAEVSQRYIETQLAAAQRYFDTGDYTMAAKTLADARLEATERAPVIGRYVAQAETKINEAKAANATVPADVAKDYATFRDPTKFYAGILGGADKLSTELWGTVDQATGSITSKGILKLNNGAPVIGPDGEATLADGVVRTVDAQGRVKAVVAPTIGTNNDGTRQYGIKGKVEIQLHTLTGFVPAYADYTVGRIGRASASGTAVDIFGKLVTVNGETWVENPFKPGQWVPQVQGRDIAFTLPKDARVGPVPAALPNTPTGAQAITFGGVNMLVFDGATGTYQLWTNGTQGQAQPGAGKYGAQVVAEGTPVFVGAAANEFGQANANVAGAISGAGIGFDPGSLTKDQNAYLAIRNGRGAWLGGANPDVVSRFFNPKPGTPALTPTVNPWTGFVTGNQPVPAATGYAASRGLPASTPLAYEGTAPANAYVNRITGPQPTGVTYGSVGAYSPPTPTYQPQTAAPIVQPNLAVRTPTGSSYISVNRAGSLRIPNEDLGGRIAPLPIVTKPPVRTTTAALPVPKTPIATTASGLKPL